MRSRSRNDAALFIGNQAGAVGWSCPLFQIGDGLNANPLQTTETILGLKGSPTIANGIDLSGATSITGAAFKSPSFSVSGAGKINVGSANTSFFLGVKAPDNSGAQVLFAGSVRGVRIWTDANPSAAGHIEGVDQTGVGSYQPLQVGGSTVLLQIAGTTQASLFASGGFGVGTAATDPGGGSISAQGTIAAGSQRALVSGGTTSFGLKLSSAANFGIFFGSGVPTISAGTGSLYLRNDAANATRFYPGADCGRRVHHREGRRWQGGAGRQGRARPKGKVRDARPSPFLRVVVH
jgi:hypothetical protein